VNDQTCSRMWFFRCLQKVMLTLHHPVPPMMFIKKAPNSHGWVNPKDVEDLWRDHFDFFYREYDDFCFPVTIHPDVSGHPHVIFMLERYVFSSDCVSVHLARNPLS